jgi:hypothetical protein
LKITAVERVLTDPETNEILGLLDRPLGLIEALQVEPIYTRARPLGPFQPSIGDLVRFLPQKQLTVSPHRREVGYAIWE